MGDYATLLRQRAMEQQGYMAPTNTPRLKKQKLTFHDIQQRRFRADMDWNNFAMAHEEDRERYERKFDELNRKLSAANIIEAAIVAQAIEDLMFVEERKFCIGTETEPGAFYWYSEMDYWREVEAAYGVDKWTQDELLNETRHWFKQLWREDDPIHHAHEPAKGKSFLMPNLKKPIEKSHTRKSSVVRMTGKPAV